MTSTGSTIWQATKSSYEYVYACHCLGKLPLNAFDMGRKRTLSNQRCKCLLYSWSSIRLSWFSNYSPVVWAVESVEVTKKVVKDVCQQDSGIDQFSAAIEDCYRCWTFVKLKNFVAEVFANTWHVLHCNTCLSLQFVYNSIIGFISSCIEITCGWCQKSLQPYSNHRIPIYFLWTKTNTSDILENCNSLLSASHHYSAPDSHDFFMAPLL